MLGAAGISGEPVKVLSADNPFTTATQRELSSVTPILVKLLNSTTCHAPHA